MLKRRRNEQTIAICFYTQTLQQLSYEKNIFIHFGYFRALWWIYGEDFFTLPYIFEQIIFVSGCHTQIFEIRENFYQSQLKAHNKDSGVWESWNCFLFTDPTLYIGHIESVLLYSASRTRGLCFFVHYVRMSMEIWYW